MPTMTKTERFLQIFLRIMGSVTGLALPCAMMPYSWMNAIHQYLGMGTLPSEPIVGYLARSLSAFYAFLGGLLWVLSFDVRRHRLALCYVGAGSVALGLILLGVDFVEGMPRYWRFSEGPFGATLGALLLWLSWRVRRYPADTVTGERKP
jgi:hypothetical protein